MEFVLDADATHNLRALGILEILIDSDVAIALTGFVFTQELANLQSVLEPNGSRPSSPTTLLVESSESPSGALQVSQRGSRP